MSAAEWLSFKALILLYRNKKIDRESFTQLWAELQEKNGYELG